MPAKPLPRILLLSLIALALLWAGALALLARAGRPADAFASADKIDFRLSARPGMNLRPEDLAPGALGPALDRLSAAGVRFVRFTLPWDEIEPARGAYLWDKWDEVAAAFAARPDLQPVVVLDRSPEWARRPEDAGNPLAPPQERRDFGAFARAAAERYGEVYTYFQPWDEPNIAPHWGARPADPVDYAGLLREAAINIRAADRNARILAAALAPTIEEGPANLSDITYLDRLYAAGGREWFDYPAAQLYGFSDPPGAAAASDRLNFAALVAATRGHAPPRGRRHCAVGDRFRLERGRRRRPANRPGRAAGRLHGGGARPRPAAPALARAALVDRALCPH